MINLAKPPYKHLQVSHHPHTHLHPQFINSQDLDQDHSSESTEDSDGSPPLEDITSDSGYEADAENLSSPPTPNRMKKKHEL